MVGIVRSGVYRTEHNVSNRVTLMVYGSAGTAAGAFAGTVVGGVGSWVSLEARTVVATTLALAAIVVSVLDLSGRWVRVFQINRETPYHWLALGRLGWAIRNGAAIGFGAMTRLGFWLWYVIPIGALVSGAPLLGAIGWGGYAATRTFGAGLIAAVERRSWFSDIELLRYASQARIATDLQLFAVGAVAILVVGV